MKVFFILSVSKKKNRRLKANSRIQDTFKNIPKNNSCKKQHTKLVHLVRLLASKSSILFVRLLVFRKHILYTRGCQSEDGLAVEYVRFLS